MGKSFEHRGSVQRERIIQSKHVEGSDPSQNAKRFDELLDVKSEPISETPLNRLNENKLDNEFKGCNVLASLKSVFLINNEISELDESPDGEKYVGQIVDNKREGDGAWLRQDGSVVYTGDWQNNVMEGEGTYNFISGSYYSGSWVDGHMEGEGTFHSANHWIYQGGFAASRRHGKGTYEDDFNFHVKYEGEWACDLPHGEGTLETSDGTIIRGQFQHGDYVSGRTEWPNGDIYTGEWREGQRHGHGTSIFSDGGKEYEGKWQHGLPHGYGKLKVTVSHSENGWYGNGYSCEGGWFEGRMHGKITEQFSDGRGSFTGEFENGLRHGRGILFVSDWGRIEGNWEDGMLRTVACISATPVQAGHTPEGSLGSSTHQRLALLVAELLVDSSGGCSMQTEIPIGHSIFEDDLDETGHVSVQRSASSRKLRRGISSVSVENDALSTASFSWTLADDDDSCSILSTNSPKFFKVEYPDGSTFIGEVDVRTRLPHGSGIITSPNGDTCEAKWVNGVLVGEVVYRYASGGVYKGCSSRGKKNGQGCLEVEGAVYEGSWVNDKPHGEGTFKDLENEFEYSGQWESGQMDGYGSLKIRGGKNYSGHWKNGKRQGKGRLQAEDGSCYDGSWVADQAEGKGVYTWPDGTKYQGEWSNGTLEGRGRMTIPSDSVAGEAEVYDGDWVANSRQGQGILRFPDGSFYEGAWANNCPEGAGVFVNPHGVLFRGIWREGILDALLCDQMDNRGVPVGVMEGSSYQLQEDLKGNSDPANSLLDNRVVVPLPDPGSPEMMARFPRPRIFNNEDIVEDYYQEESSAFVSTLKPVKRKPHGSGYLYHSRFAAEYWAHSSHVGLHSQPGSATEPCENIKQESKTDQVESPTPKTPSTSPTRTEVADLATNQIENSNSTVTPITPAKPPTAITPSEAFTLYTDHSPIAVQPTRPERQAQPTFGIRPLPFAEPRLGVDISQSDIRNLTGTTFACGPTPSMTSSCFTTGPYERMIRNTTHVDQSASRPPPVIYTSGSPTPVVSYNTLPAVPYTTWPTHEENYASRFSTMASAYQQSNGVTEATSSKKQMMVVPAQRIETIGLSSQANVSFATENPPRERRQVQIPSPAPVYLQGKIYDSRLDRVTVPTVFIPMARHTVDQVQTADEEVSEKLKPAVTRSDQAAWNSNQLNEKTLSQWNKYVEFASAVKTETKRDFHTSPGFNFEVHSIPVHPQGVYSFRPQTPPVKNQLVSKSRNNRSYQRVDHLGQLRTAIQASRVTTSVDTYTKFESVRSTTPAATPVSQIEFGDMTRLQSWGGESAQLVRTRPRRKMEVVERIVEVPEIVYRDQIVEKIVEVPEVRYETVIKEVVVPQYKEVAHRQEMVTLMEVERSRNIPIPVEAVSEVYFTFPKLRAVRREIKYPVFVPRYIDVPVFSETLSPEGFEMCNHIARELDKVSSDLRMGTPGATIAYEQLSNVLFDMYDDFEEFQELKAAVRPPCYVTEGNLYHEMKEEDLAGSAECSRRSPVPMISGFDLKQMMNKSRSGDDQGVPTTARVEDEILSSVDADLSRKVTDVCEECVSSRRGRSFRAEGRGLIEDMTVGNLLHSCHSDQLTKEALEIDDDEFLEAEASRGDLSPDTNTAVICFEALNGRMSQGTFVAEDEGVRAMASRRSEDELDEEDSRELDSQFRYEDEDDGEVSQELEEDFDELESGHIGDATEKKHSQDHFSHISDDFPYNEELDDDEDAETYDN